MESLANIRSISQTLRLVMPNQLELNHFYVLKVRQIANTRINYIVKYIGDNYFIKIYEREPRERIQNFNRLNSRQWSIVEGSLNVRKFNFIINGASRIYEIPSLSPVIMQDLKERSKNPNNNSNARAINVNSLNKENMKLLLTCPICLKYSKNKVLKCGHALCNKCAKVLSNKSPITCPICTKKMEKKNITNLFL
jgi:hypothetical protein